MNNLNLWCKTFCVISVVGGVIISLLPKGKVNSALKTLVGILIIYTFFVPISDKIGSYISADKSNDAASFTQDELNDINQKTIVNLAEDLLKKNINDYIQSIDSNSYCIECKISTKESTKVENIVIESDGDDETKDKIRSYIVGIIGGDEAIEFIKD